MAEGSWEEIERDPRRVHQLLTSYYMHIFPYKDYYRWLCYGKSPAEYFARRELVFIYASGAHMRYKSFDNLCALKDAINKAVPSKIDIGAVYNQKPCLRKETNAPSIEAQERELIFDIDLTDYDDVRVCCQGGNMCVRCWKFIQAAVAVLDKTLEEDFDFKHRLWIYSGRRGIHCWVADQTARQLNRAQRNGIFGYVNVLEGGAMNVRKVRLPTRAYVESKRTLPLHSSIERAYRVLTGAGGGRNYFMEIAIDQGLFDEDCRKIIGLLPPIKDERRRNCVMKRMGECLQEPSSAALKWTRLLQMFDETYLHSLLKSRVPLEEDRIMAEYIRNNLHFPVELVLHMTYPRLDANVTKGVNHLLKSPFSCHPATGRIAVPLSAERIEAFTLEAMPRIDQLVHEAAAARQANKESENVEEPNRLQLEYKRTSLDEYVTTFKRFVDNLIENVG